MIAAARSVSDVTVAAVDSAACFDGCGPRCVCWGVFTSRLVIGG